MNKAFEKILERFDAKKQYFQKFYEADGKTEEDKYINKATQLAFDDAKNIVQEVAEEYNGGWITCSERLPECGIKVLVQYGCGRINIEECKKNTDGIIGFYDGNYWSNADNYISWRPLPEPYKERD